MDKLKAMQAFIHIAEQGSLTAAAQVMESSLPAMVRTLAGFEAQLGVRLFNRTTRRISLTEEGRRHLESCRQLLAALADAESALSADAAEPAGQLTITAPMLFGQMHVAPAVTRFVQQHEKMRCSMVLLDRVVNLLEEGIDVGIRIGEPEDSSLVAQQVGQIRRLVVASPTWLRRHGVPQHPKDLLKANCVRVTDHSPTWGPFIDQGRPLRLAVSGNLEFNQIAPAVAACAAGAGFGSFLSYQVAPYLQTKQLRTVLEEFEPPPRPINIVYPHARLLPMRTRVFIEWMKQELKEFQP
ncbi:LysR family transcriptional regulator [Polaromonas sp. JS666]|uniref:LysR family transcriptional regulator n=1 Tax=Polaromonas sp. (strain JS666 / ATCC BAA-500) TaxID=296591 RepID=UPI00088BB35F|nr:LysR family transcriptional regulator [Polaromonas sp. JS666]SDN89531.1 DNA-binding transcriptional regulator, LysR family [Polaromonas sp. JS666]